MTVSSSPRRQRHGTNRTNKLRFVVIFRHFQPGCVSGQLCQGFARHDFLPFISHFGSSRILSTVRADVEWPPAAGRAGCFGGGWEAGCFSGREFCRSFPAPTRISAEKKKNFSLVTPPGITVRNSLPALARSRIQLRPGEPGKPAPRAPRRGRGGGVRREPLAPGARRGRNSAGWVADAAGTPDEPRPR